MARNSRKFNIFTFTRRIAKEWRVAYRAFGARFAIFQLAGLVCATTGFVLLTDWRWGLILTGALIALWGVLSEVSDG